MSSVYIDSFSVENFGPFYGFYEFDFSDLHGRCGILIGGKNGAGKTHLLRALYLAVVGESGRIDLTKLDKGSEATRFNLEKSLNRRAHAEGINTVKLSITISQRDSKSSIERKIRLYRKIHFRPNASPIWESHAERLDGSANIIDEKQLEKLRDAFLPRHLARFFFFDAERSQSVNLRQEDIVEGISRILGLWSYTELESDLRQLIAKKIPRSFNASDAREASTQLLLLSNKIFNAEDILSTHRKELTQLEFEHNETQNQLSEVEYELSSQGALDPEILAQIQERRSEISHNKSQLEEHLRLVWEQALPLSLLGNFRKTLYDALIREEKRREWENTKELIEPIIPQIKREVFEDEDIEDENSLSKDARTFYKLRLEKALQNLFSPPKEMMKEQPFLTSRNDISAQIRSLLDKSNTSISQVAKSTKKIDLLSVKLREVDARLKQANNNQAFIERGQVLHQKRGELSGVLNVQSTRLDILRHEIGELELELKELKEQENTYNSVLQKVAQGKTLAGIAGLYRETTTRIKELAAVELREQISNYVGELWIEITGREREFTGLEFDSNWNCNLIRGDGERIAWEDANPSAGQRQVRLLAFYEALRRLARSVPPLVVDTPLGRLDKEVRENVLNKLYLSGHQSLILSTNSEIDPESPLFDSVKGRFARAYTLHSHGEPNSIDYHVKVSNDYFGRKVETDVT